MVGIRAVAAPVGLALLGVLLLSACSSGSPAGSAAASGGAPAASGGAPAGSGGAPAGSGGVPAGSGGQQVPSGGGSAGSQDATVRLQRAVATGDLAAVQRAIADGADLERRDRDGRTPLVAATKADRVKVARALLDAGADPDAKDDLQDSAFLYAGAEGLDEILALTLQRGADVRSTNRFGGTALIPASEHAHVATVRTLLAAGVPVNHVNDLGWTALHEAIVLGNGDQDHTTVVRLLLEAGADPTIPDRGGKLPRQLAADAGHTAIVAELDRHR